MEEMKVDGNSLGTYGDSEREETKQSEYEKVMY